MELGRALDRYLEARVRSRLDPDDLDVVPCRQHVNNLSQPGHALGSETLQDERLVLVQVENVLDDANVLVCWQSVANRQQICEVMLLSRLFVSALALRLLLAVRLLLGSLVVA